MKSLQKVVRANPAKALVLLVSAIVVPSMSAAQSLQCSETSYPMVCRGPLQIQSKVVDATCGNSDRKGTAPCYLANLYLHFDRSNDGEFKAGTCRFLDRNVQKTEPRSIEIVQPRKSDFFDGETFSAADPFSLIKNGTLIQKCAESASCQFQACVYSYNDTFAMNPSEVLVSYSDK